MLSIFVLDPECIGEYQPRTYMDLVDDEFTNFTTAHTPATFNIIDDSDSTSIGSNNMKLMST
jgi:hypothetical protein